MLDNITKSQKMIEEAMKNLSQIELKITPINTQASYTIYALLQESINLLTKEIEEVSKMENEENGNEETKN